ncbi:MAG TPA: hypothetical protein VN843_12035, partial [Anaerolineales bacterium]|nr:hypothetical protein [Anaerolineales bacterium]
TEIANLNPSSADSFVNRLISLAKDQTAIMNVPHDRQGVSLTQPRALLLHGQRGSGKTFFENYILSKYSNYFDEQRIIWIRINLVDSIGYDDKLISWINAQSSKIILRYYNRESGYFAKSDDLHIDVESYLREKVFPAKHRKERLELQRQLEAAKEHFFFGGRGERAEEKISEEVISSGLAHHVVSAARHAGFHFIVVLDGLDVLEITRAYRDRFDKLMTKSLELASTTERMGFALLLVTRTNTLRMILRHDYQDTYEQTEMEEVSIVAIPLTNIIESRLRNIEAEVREIASTGTVDWNDADIYGHLQAFERFLHENERIHGKVIDIKYIHLLEELQAENVRAKMQMVQYKYYDFLSKRRGATLRAPYHLVEALMKAGRRFPPIAYRYVSERGLLIRAIWNRQKFDSRFFPSLFRFPFVSGRFANRRHATQRLTGTLNSARLEYILLGIRILQLLRAMTKYYKDENRADAASSLTIGVDQLCELLNFAFDYDSDFVLRVLEEFSEYQLLEFQNPNLYLKSRRLEDNEIICLPKIDHMLNHFMYDIAYLNMAAMRIALPPLAFTSKSVGYFQAASYDEADDPLSTWVSAKITNVCGLVRLLDAVNREQERVYQMKMTEDPALPPETLKIFEIAEDNDMFSFIYFLRDEVIKQFYLTLSGVHPEATLRETLPRIRKYIQEWGARN